MGWSAVWDWEQCFASGANLIGLATGLRHAPSLISMRMVALRPDLEGGEELQRRLRCSVFLAGLAVLAIALSFTNPRVAL